VQSSGTVQFARQIENARIPRDTVSLREVSAWALQTLVATAVETEDPSAKARRAHLLIKLGSRQRDLDQLEAALISTNEGKEIFRKLAEANPAVFQPYLAASLSNLSAMQSALGQGEAAYASAYEAVRLYRALAATNAKKFLPYLAGSLTNLSNTQTVLGWR